MLATIAAHPSARNCVGFKASGGIKTTQDAIVYEAITQLYLGESSLNAKRFRIGASNILNDIEAVLNPSAAPAQAPAKGY